MRNGHWRKSPVPSAAFPEPVSWFSDNSDFPGLAIGLRGAGLSEPEISGILGENWITFWEKGFVGVC
jgi:microsomal dipeptidase-like Zn-dependent dipeptidase